VGETRLRDVIEKHRHGAGRVVLIDLLPQQHVFRSLRDDAQDGALHGMHQLRVREARMACTPGVRSSKRPS
jgi:hypothetical protein